VSVVGVAPTMKATMGGVHAHLQPQDGSAAEAAVKSPRAVSFCAKENCPAT
jgi:hypothetical protein